MSAAIHESRRLGVGCSQAAAIIGVTPTYQTPMDVWEACTGRAKEFEASLPMRHGTFVEDFIAQEYTRATGRHVVSQLGLMTHPHGRLIGHVDRLVVAEDGGVECKAVSAFLSNDTDLWGPEGSDQVPPQYFVQVLGYLELTGRSWWDLAALFGSSELRIYRIHADRALQRDIVERVTSWWDQYVVTDTPPPPSTEDDAKRVWRAHNPGKSVEFSPQLAGDVETLKSVNAEIKRLEQQAQDLRNRILPAIEDAEIAMFAGKKLLTWKANKSSAKVDWKAVAQDLEAPPDIIAKHTTQTPGARVLRIAI